jgi:hypothetical protein
MGIWPIGNLQKDGNPFLVALWCSGLMVEQKGKYIASVSRGRLAEWFGNSRLQNPFILGFRF